MGAYYGTGAGELTADSSLQGITKSHGGGEAYNFNSGNLAKGSVAFPVGALLGAGAQVFNGFMQGNAMRNQTKMEWELGKANLAAAERAGLQNLLAGQYGMTGGQQFAQGLQRDAADYQQAFLDPRKSILGAEDLSRKAAFQLGPFGQQLRQQQNADTRDQTLAGKYSPYFGNISVNPYSFGVMPGYTANSLV